MDNGNYRKLEDIRQRKAELQRLIDRDGERVGRLWGQLFVKREEASKGEYISSIISNGAFAIDAFLLIRKLRKNYRTFRQLFGRKKSK